MPFQSTRPKNRKETRGRKRGKEVGVKKRREEEEGEVKRKQR